MSLIPLLLQVVTVGQWDACGGFGHFAGGREGASKWKKTKQRDESRIENKGGLDQGHVIEKSSEKIVAFKFSVKKAFIRFCFGSGLDANFILILAYFLFCGRVVFAMVSRDVVKMLASEFAKVACFYVSNK